MEVSLDGVQRSQNTSDTVKSSTVESQHTPHLTFDYVLGVCVSHTTCTWEIEFRDSYGNHTLEIKRWKDLCMEYQTVKVSPRV